jgi:hypothetical protein
MVRALSTHGLHSIMQVKKKRGWPKGMPAQDIVDLLGQELCLLGAGNL